jgi:hypothetical protein
MVKSHPDYPHPNFRFILVDTVKEIQDENGKWYTDSFEYYEDYLLHNYELGNVFYGVYASYHIDNVKSGLRITETESLEQAINIAQEIMGNSIEEAKINW